MSIRHFYNSYITKVVLNKDRIQNDLLPPSNWVVKVMFSVVCVCLSVYKGGSPSFRDLVPHLPCTGHRFSCTKSWPQPSIHCPDGPNMFNLVHHVAYKYCWKGGQPSFDWNAFLLERSIWFCPHYLTKYPTINFTEIGGNNMD